LTNAFDVFVVWEGHGAKLLLALAVTFYAFGVSGDSALLGAQVSDAFSHKASSAQA